MTQTPKNNWTCRFCFFYREREDERRSLTDYTGYCVEPYNRSHGINGRCGPEKDRIGVMDCFECNRWQDATLQGEPF